MKKIETVTYNSQPLYCSTNIPINRNPRKLKWWIGGSWTRRNINQNSINFRIIDYQTLFSAN